MTWLNDATVTTAAEKAEQAIEAENIRFKSERAEALNSSTITISTGKVFDADEISITRMSESKQAIQDAIEVGLITTVDEYPLQWVLHGSKTGEGTPITYLELVEASALANQNRSSIWLRK
jgi:hypothetical protein